MKNSIEETIKQLKLMLKVRKQQKEIIECAGGSCMNCNPDIKALSESIDILSEYKKILKENEQLSTEVNSLKKENEELKYKYNKALSDVIAGVDLDNTYMSKQKIKDKLEELNKEIKSCTEIDAIFKIKQQQILQELLESEE